eukprot:GHVT01019105.1.p1 GENE.GHVT01019105.1~~GHVT01019105.1.p1  ORF type:complete len:890 (+),score=109.74 GHVT01019105.1:145-2814(+)
MENSGNGIFRFGGGHDSEMIVYDQSNPEKRQNSNADDGPPSKKSAAATTANQNSNGTQNDLDLSSVISFWSRLPDDLWKIDDSRTTGLPAPPVDQNLNQPAQFPTGQSSKNSLLKTSRADVAAAATMDAGESVGSGGHYLQPGLANPDKKLATDNADGQTDPVTVAGATAHPVSQPSSVPGKQTPSSVTNNSSYVSYPNLRKFLAAANSSKDKTSVWSVYSNDQAVGQPLLSNLIPVQEQEEDFDNSKKTLEQLRPTGSTCSASIIDFVKTVLNSVQKSDEYLCYQNTNKEKVVSSKKTKNLESFLKLGSSTEDFITTNYKMFGQINKDGSNSVFQLFDGKFENIALDKMVFMIVPKDTSDCSVRAIGTGKQFIALQLNTEKNRKSFQELAEVIANFREGTQSNIEPPPKTPCTQTGLASQPADPVANNNSRKPKNPDTVAGGRAQFHFYSPLVPGAQPPFSGNVSFTSPLAQPNVSQIQSAAFELLIGMWGNPISHNPTSSTCMHARVGSVAPLSLPVAKDCQCTRVLFIARLYFDALKFAVIGFLSAFIHLFLLRTSTSEQEEVFDNSKKTLEKLTPTGSTCSDSIIDFVETVLKDVKISDKFLKYKNTDKEKVVNVGKEKNLQSFIKLKGTIQDFITKNYTMFGQLMQDGNYPSFFIDSGIFDGFDSNKMVFMMVPKSERKCSIRAIGTGKEFRALQSKTAENKSAYQRLADVIATFKNKAQSSIDLPPDTSCIQPPGSGRRLLEESYRLVDSDDFPRVGTFNHRYEYTADGKKLWCCDHFPSLKVNQPEVPPAVQPPPSGTVRSKSLARSPKKLDGNFSDLALAGLGVLVILLFVKNVFCSSGRKKKSSKYNHHEQLLKGRTRVIPRDSETNSTDIWFRRNPKNY